MEDSIIVHIVDHEGKETAREYAFRLIKHIIISLKLESGIIMDEGK